MAKKNKSLLTKSNESALLSLLNSFKGWLTKKGLVESSNIIQHKYMLKPFANEDWFMRVDDSNKEVVSFNTMLLNRCPFNYFKVIMLHEYFHLVVQRVPNKEDAVRIKDDFGDQLMKLIDIEADYFVAQYYKEELSYTLVKYLQLYYEGNKVFADKRIRIMKFERFIGSLLSMGKMFIKSDAAPNVQEFCDLYLPSISPIYTESSMHVLVITKEHIHFDEIDAKYDDFVRLKDCYTNADTLLVKGYIQHLIEFICKALKIKMPHKVRMEIDSIKEHKKH